MASGSSASRVDEDAKNARSPGAPGALVLIAAKEHGGVFAELGDSLSKILALGAPSSFRQAEKEYLRASAAVDPARAAMIRDVVLQFRDRLAAYAILPFAPLDPRLVVFDTDSTFIDQEVIDEIADFAGMKPKVARITELAMQGKLDFNAALQERVALLKDLPETTLGKVLDTRVTVTRGGAELVNELTKAGAQTYLLSGGFSFFTSALRRRYSLTGDYANELEIEGGRLTGRTRGEIVNRVRKANLLRQIAAEAKIPLERTVAIGDGANDIDMTEASGLGIAFCAKPALYEVTRAAIFERDLRLVARLVYPHDRP